MNVVLDAFANGNICVIDQATDVRRLMQDISRSGIQEDAFYICDLGQVVQQHSQWMLQLPRVQPYYAVKCNDTPAVLEVLAALGTGFDCASKAELTKVLDVGVSPDRIIFANPTKMASHMRFANNSGVRLTTFDNERELHKIRNFMPTAELALRIRCDSQVSQCPLGMKFGADPSDGPALLALARDMDLDVVGISFHVGSGCQDPPVFARAIATCKWLFGIGESLGYCFRLLDIGGGFPGNKNTSISEIAHIVNDALEQHFPKGCGVDIIAEPGRYYVASAFSLATLIHSLRPVSENTSTESYMYYINDGVYGSFNCLLYDHATVSAQPLIPPDPAETLVECSVWGPTCDGLDQVCKGELLPILNVGDWLLFEDMGAYTMSAAGTFNGFPVPKVFNVIHSEAWLLLKKLMESSTQEIEQMSNLSIRRASLLLMDGGWEHLTTNPNPTRHPVQALNDFNIFK